jgi:hypothetical protein
MTEAFAVVAGSFGVGLFFDVVEVVGRAVDDEE